MRRLLLYDAQMTLTTLRCYDAALRHLLRNYSSGASIPSITTFCSSLLLHGRHDGGICCRRYANEKSALSQSRKYSSKSWAESSSSSRPESAKHGTPYGFKSSTYSAQDYISVDNCDYRSRRQQQYPALEKTGTKPARYLQTATPHDDESARLEAKKLRILHKKYGAEAKSLENRRAREPVRARQDQLTKKAQVFKQQQEMARERLEERKTEKKEIKLLNQQRSRQQSWRELHNRVTEYFSARDKVLIAVDIKTSPPSWGSVITEVGIAVWDLRASTAVDAKFAALRHIKIEENMHLPNAKGEMTNSADFGESEILTLDECARQVRELFSVYGEHAVYVGHSVKINLKMMRKLGAKFDSPTPRVDTVKLWRHYVGKKKTANLDHVLRVLALSVKDNAGHEAWKTMSVVQKLYGTTEEATREEAAE
ncbi:uncharacterized protein V1518DRAFT_418884 [Limtongia smithiae]|uniref:uncharacterized protein n=1 Tax=Limtongia smithiae TaxID=1125753 RepID=UPI0034CF28D0